MTIRECLDQPIWPYCAVVAWFVQMGVHEGMHAHVAYKLGDPTADFLGKRSMNPFRHIEWNSINSILVSIVLPIYTVFGFGYPVPLGMAWVPVNVGNLRNPRRDDALVSIAGPVGNALVCAACLVVHFAVLRWLPADNQVVPVLETLVGAIYLTSLTYGLFNIIPIPPLDGSHVLYYFAPHELRKAIDAIRPWGFLILVGIFWFVDPVNDAFWAVLAFFGGLYL